jgi:hypothetical protein
MVSWHTMAVLRQPPHPGSSPAVQPLDSGVPGRESVDDAALVLPTLN